MKLTLQRQHCRPDGIFSALFDESGGMICVALEHSYENVPKLPVGEYECKRGTHRLEHGPEFETFEILNVPGHTGILFHTGNYNCDSKGCVLLGLAIVTEYPLNSWWVASSGRAFRKFMTLLGGVDSFTLVVE